MKSTNWQKNIEYFFLLSSAVGTVIAAITQQVVYATAPLTIALCLNTLNRQRRQEEQNQYLQQARKEIVNLNQTVDNFSASVTQVIDKPLEVISNQYQELKNKVENQELSNIQVFKKITNLNKKTQNITVESSQLEQELMLVREQLSYLQGDFDPQAINEKINFLDQLYRQQDTKLIHLNGKIDDIDKLVLSNATDLESQIESLKHIVEILRSQDEFRRQEIKEIKIEIQKIKTEIKDLQQKISNHDHAKRENSSSSFDLDEVKRELEELDRKCTAMQENIDDDINNLRNQVEGQIKDATNNISRGFDDMFKNNLF